ncbi:MAG: 2-dehydropantoate 2-reductase [Burkholderiales bacterium]|nr:2-dehydropantoate 2-reductase [Burkholderiales bacterium]
MKACIYGAGAIGGFIGTRLGAQGHAIGAVARGATLAALRNQGMRLRMGGTETVVPVAAADDAHALGVQDLVVVAVKEPAMRAVAAGIGPLLGADTIVLTAMNGVPWWFFDGMPGPCAGLALKTLDPTGAVAAAIPIRHVVGCVVHASCLNVAPGVVQHVKDQRLIVGEPAGGFSRRVEQLVSHLAAAGFECQVSERIQQDVWYKLWGNMTMNPASALTGATLDRILADPLASDFCKAVMEEAKRTGHAIGCPIEQTVEDRNAITRKLGAIKTSMLQDVEAGKPLEIDALLTVVREIAQHVGVPTPSLDALLGLSRVFARGRGLYPADEQVDARGVRAATG